MKTFVIAALFAAVAAESPDCPESTTVFSYNERVPAAAGLLQVSACQNAGVNGVTCSPPNSELFASGMNGDEDLGETIKMKGDTYKFQQNLAQSGFASGMNGDEDLGETIKMKGDTYKFNQNLSQFASGMNGDEDLGETIKMKGDTYKFEQSPENNQYFASGMNGDEDLGETIKMKGDTYKFNEDY